MTDEARNVGIVFDDEQTWFHGIILAGKGNQESVVRSQQGNLRVFSSDFNNSIEGRVRKALTTKDTRVPEGNPEAIYEGSQFEMTTLLALST